MVSVDSSVGFVVKQREREWWLEGCGIRRDNFMPPHGWGYDMNEKKK